MRIESRGDRARRLAQGRDGPDAAHARNLGCAARSLRPRARSRSIRTTTSWRARLSCARCTTATDRRDSSRRIMPGRGDTKIIATGIVRCRRKPSLTSRRLSLLSGTARPMGLSSWRPPIRRPGHRRRSSSRDRQALNLSIARQPSSRRTTRRLPSRCATCRPSRRNPMGCSSTFPQRGRSRDRAALPSTCRYIASVSSRFPCRLGGFGRPRRLHRSSRARFRRQARRSVLPGRRKGRQGRSAETNRPRAR